MVVTIQADNTGRRQALKSMGAALGLPAAGFTLAKMAPNVNAAKLRPEWKTSIKKGLDWVVRSQSSLGHWTAGTYPTAMTALAGTALICSGSTTTQGPYARAIRKCVDYITTKCRSNGLIGDPLSDNRYTYGHGFSMLFLSQVLGEEDRTARRAVVRNPAVATTQKLEVVWVWGDGGGGWCGGRWRTGRATACPPQETCGRGP